jgi:phosphoglycerate dehydrogenase-like enzyme
MKTLFLGPFAARVAPTILAKMTEKTDYDTLADESDTQRLIPLLGEAEIVVGHIWKKGFPEAPRLKFIQSTAAGLDLIDVPSIPPGVVLCNVFGHEPAIAEYVIATILVLQQRLLDRVSAFRAGSWPADGPGGGTRHGEMLGATIGIVGYGRIGRDVAKRAVAFGCEVIGANRSPIADPGDASQIYPLDELDQMLPRCDVVVIAAGLAPETQGLIDARRLALMKPGALLINIGRARIVDEEALYAALRDGQLGGAALDVWWRYPSPTDPHVRPSHLPFHELPNVLMTPHTSSASDSTAERRWSVVADNLDRFVRGERLANIVTIIPGGTHG